MNTPKHYDFFISGRWRNRDKVVALTHEIRKKGHSAYCFFETLLSKERAKNDPEEEMKFFEKLDWRNDPYVKDIFTTDMEAEKNSDVFVMLLPAGKSCHIEAGAAYGMGKKCILIGKQKEAESLYLIFHEIYTSEADFLKTI